MLYLFLVQSNGDAFLVVFKPLENPPFWRLLGVRTVASIYYFYYFDRMLSHISPGIKYLKVSCIT